MSCSEKNFVQKSVAIMFSVFSFFLAPQLGGYASTLDSSQNTSRPIAISPKSNLDLAEPGRTIENPITISSKSDFDSFVDEVNSGNTFENQYIVLANNIYLNSSEKIGGKLTDWCSAGFCMINNQTKKILPMSKAFQGHFDAQGHTIDCNINFDKNTSKGTALFGYAGERAVIKNLNIVGYFKTSNSNKALAAICDVNYGTIENCKVRSKEIYGSYGAAGVCNTNYGTIKGCESTGRITTKDFICSGICGTNHGTIENCKTCSLLNNCVEKGIKGDGVFKMPESAGIAAYNYGQIINCEAKSYILNANVNVTNGYEYYQSRAISAPDLHDGCIGGIVSRNNGLIEKCKFSGYINGYQVGGICAVNYETISDCSTNCKINGIVVGGISAQNLVGDKKMAATCVRKLPGGLIKNCATSGEINTLHLAGELVCSDFWSDNRSVIENCQSGTVINYLKL